VVPSGQCAKSCVSEWLPQRLQQAVRVVAVVAVVQQLARGEVVRRQPVVAAVPPRLWQLRQLP
jgi:hypothetical protein